MNLKYSYLYFQKMGLSMIHRAPPGLLPDKLDSKSEDRTFRSVFGTNWNVVAEIWHLIEKNGANKNKKPIHLLWALTFLKVYSNEQSLVMMTGGATLKTFRKWVWIVLDEMSVASAIKVRIRLSFILNSHCDILSLQFYHLLHF